MKTEFLPTQYHLEVYENNDPSLFMQSSTPFSTISVGDYLEHRLHEGWYDRPSENEKFVIKQIEHIFWSMKDHNSHKIMILVKKEPYS